MTKYYSFLALLLLFCKISFANNDGVTNNRLYNSNTLNLTMFELTGTREISNAVLDWRIITSENVDYFEIERSINSGIYITIAAIHQPVYLNEMQSLNYADNIYGIAAEKIMYRVKIISKSNKTKYSNVSVINPRNLKKVLSIVPNEAKNYVDVGFYSQKNTTVVKEKLQMAKHQLVRFSNHYFHKVKD